MYKFTNGVVCYDIETRDKYIKAGMTLVEEKTEIKEEKIELKEDNNGEECLQGKAECAGPRRTVKQSSKFNRRHK